MKTDLIKRLFALVLCCLCVFCSPLDIFATISSEDQEKIDSYEQKQKELQDKIDAANAEIEILKQNIKDKEAYAGTLATQIENYQAQIDVLNTRIEDLEAQKSVIQEKIDTLNAEITEIDEDITENKNQQQLIQSEIDGVYLKLQQRLYESYVNGATSELELLLDFDNNGDFSTYLITMEILSRRAKSDEELVTKLNEDIKKLEILNDELELMIKTIEVKRDEHQAQVDELNLKEDEIVKLKSPLVDAQEDLKYLQQEAYAYIKELNAESNAYKNLVASYEADIKAFDDKIDAIVNSASKGDGDFSAQPGGFIWPLQYSDVYISSNYGYRYDPISGVYKLHGGTDTCCWSGTMGKAVRASSSGTVIISTWHNSYGYYVGIDHGNGIVTIYAHNSSLNVSVGQNVNQGDIVAYAGSTGYSTGAHCHFEVRVNGTKVNPLNYASLP